MKKYKLTNISKTINGKTLYRIEALKNFVGISQGMAGGYVESEANLSQENDCWIYGGVSVYDNAKILGNIRIAGRCQICGDVKIDDERYETKILSFFDEVIDEQSKVIFQETLLKKGFDY
jgi:acetyltransferase-like isoleucine patch superfamily enzyme